MFSGLADGLRNVRLGMTRFCEHDPDREEVCRELGRTVEDLLGGDSKDSYPEDFTWDGAGPPCEEKPKEASSP